MFDRIHGLLNPNTIAQTLFLLMAIAGMLLAYWPGERTDRRLGHAMLYAGIFLFVGKCYRPIPDTFGGTAQVVCYLLFQIPLIGSAAYIAIVAANAVHRNRSR